MCLKISRHHIAFKEFKSVRLLKICDYEIFLNHFFFFILKCSDLCKLVAKIINRFLIPFNAKSNKHYSRYNFLHRWLTLKIYISKSNWPVRNARLVGQLTPRIWIQKMCIRVLDCKYCIYLLLLSLIFVSALAFQQIFQQSMPAIRLPFLE